MQRCALLVLLLASALSAAQHTTGVRVPILVYHRFDPVTSGPMTIPIPAFQSHLNYLRDNGYQVIRLHALVDYLQGRVPAPPPRSVVITVDDGHRSVYTELLPLVRERKLPVTLFIYPSAISHAGYALTWAQLRELSRTGLFDVESHTYWHPNFNTERRRLDPQRYAAFVTSQLTRSKATLERMLGCRVDLLAWPFGIYDEDLMRRAAESGYIAGFTIERRPVRESDAILALPRFLIADSLERSAFAHLLETALGEEP